MVDAKKNPLVGRMLPQLISESSRRDIVSVLIPLYNHEKTVIRTLESILKSETKNIELIVSDDGSSDKSFEHAKDWIDINNTSFYSTSIIKQPKNIGINGNLNWLVSNANGNYITLLASDDALTPNAIDIQKKFLECNLDKNFVFANMGVINDTDNVLTKRIVSKFRAKLISIPALSIMDLIFNWGPPWSRLFARRKAFNSLGSYLAEHSFEDRWSALKIAETRQYGYLDHVVHLYRIRKEGLGTGGVDPSLLIRDMLDVEKRLLPETTGLLHVCLYIRVKSFSNSSRFGLGRIFWIVLRKLIEALWKRVAGDWR